MNLSVRFETITPSCCGHTFALPKGRVEQLKESHETFWCPNCKGGNWFPGLSDKEQLEQQVKDLELSVNSAEMRAERSQRSANAYRGHLTRTKRRVGKGVCPCCNKHFEKLGRHMESKHPGYAEDGD